MAVSLTRPVQSPQLVYKLISPYPWWRTVQWLWSQPQSPSHTQPCSNIPPSWSILRWTWYGILHYSLWWYCQPALQLSSVGDHHGRWHCFLLHDGADNAVAVQPMPSIVVSHLHMVTIGQPWCPPPRRAPCSPTCPWPSAWLGSGRDRSPLGGSPH